MALYTLQPAPRGAPASSPYLTYFLIDGMTQEVFERELEAGRLPNIADLSKHGLRVRDGIASFPSMTGYGFYPFITGYDAARSGVKGLRWLDRGKESGAFRNYVGRTFRVMNEDFAPNPQTIYERVAPLHTSTFNSYVNRGARWKRMFGWNFSMAKYREQNAAVRLLSRIPLVGPWLFPDFFGAESMVVDKAIQDLERAPKVQWITFTSTDGRSHMWGTDEQYVELVRAADREIGRYRAAARERGLDEGRIYAVLSDHGMVNVTTNVDLRAPLEAMGLRAWRGNPTHLTKEVLDQPWEMWSGYDAMIAINGNMLAHLYFKSESVAGWRQPPEGSVLRAHAERLRQAPGVELVLIRVASAEGGLREVSILGREGEGTLMAEPDGRWSYRCGAPDPLHYQGGLCDGRPRTAEEWLKATHTLDFPDAVTRAGNLMRQQGVGDLVVTALPGYDFGLDYEMVIGNYRGGHGGLRADQLRVPYVLSGPGIPDGAVVPTARAEDIGATLMDALGVPVGPDAEGRSLRALK